MDLESDLCIPEKFVKLRSCLQCKLIKTEEQWIREGCQNCEELKIRGDQERMILCTSARFEGMLSVMNPQHSWAAKWNGADQKIPGCYAIDVQGTIPEDVELELNRNR